MRQALVIIAQQGFQDVELAGTTKGLREAGYEIALGSKEKGECVGKFDGKEEATVAMRDVNVADFDLLVFIGGPGAHAYAADKDALDLAKAWSITGKPLAAICIGPTILAAADILQGKRATVWDGGDGTQIKFLEEHGATYSGEDVTRDGKLVTANGPKAAEAFGKMIGGL